MTSEFDEIIDRRNTHSMKWDLMEPLYGVSADDGLSMWVADMDFRPPNCVLEALHSYITHGVPGYYAKDETYREAICWWMQTRHNWSVDPAHIFTTQGLVNAVALCLHAYTQVGDGILIFTPVYHAFSRVIKAASREVVECPLTGDRDRPTFDFAAYEAQLTGREKLIVLCSPHNPGGQVWRKEELNDLAAFARKHDLIIVSDEIHHDLTYSGAHHIPMTQIEGVKDRLVMLTSTSKTFNLAGGYCGNAIISDPKLHKAFAEAQAGLGLSPNSFGLIMAEAAYSPQGAEWLEKLMAYLEENKRLFDAAITDIPALRSQPMQATYLSWVDFSGTGMNREEFSGRVAKTARIAANQGPTFGTGGESFLRFNLATPRANILEACTRLKEAFGDLQ